MATYTTAHEQLAAKSYLIQREVDATGSVITSVKHVPTDLDVDGSRELLAGWSESTGTCRTCWTMRSANGTCNC